MNVALYIRVSTEDQAKEGHSSGRLHPGTLIPGNFLKEKNGTDPFN